MATHFLDEQMQGTQEFRAEPWYNSHGDCIIYQTADEAVVADRVDEILTIYRSAIDDRPIGFQIKGVLAIVNKCGFDALAVTSEASGGEVKRISISFLLLAAYDEGPKTFKRRKAYASVMESTPVCQKSIPAHELEKA